MEENKEEKIIYPSPVECLSDDGDYIVIDKTYTNSISFIEGNNSLRIPKDYLSNCLRCRFSNEVETHDSDFDLAFLDDLTEEILKAFDKELALFRQLLEDQIWNVYVEYGYNDVVLSYISCVLKSELYRERMRINYVVQAVEALELEDKKEYYSKLIHAVRYPEEGEKERLRHKREIQAEMDIWKKAHIEAKQKIKEETEE